MQASADVHETPWSMVLVAPAVAGGRWIDEIAAPARAATASDTTSMIHAVAVIVCQVRFML